LFIETTPNYIKWRKVKIMAKSELHRDYILELESELQEFEAKANHTTKRMQMLVYPAMVAFFILSAFGFFLIYSLTSDVNRMADTIVHMSQSVDDNMTSISGTMNHMSGTMDTLGTSTEKMSNNVGKMTATTNEMSGAISGMKPAIYDMAASTNNMQRDFWSLNKNISTPLSFMNNFLPWKDDQSLPFQGSPTPLPQSYYAYPAQQAYDGGYGPQNSGQNMMMAPPVQQPTQQQFVPSGSMPAAPVGNPNGVVESNDQNSQGASVDSVPASTVTLN
jgi:hypothetical protein